MVSDHFHRKYCKNAIKINVLWCPPSFNASHRHISGCPLSCVQVWRKCDENACLPVCIPHPSQYVTSRHVECVANMWIVVWGPRASSSGALLGASHGELCWGVVLEWLVMSCVWHCSGLLARQPSLHDYSVIVLGPSPVSLRYICCQSVAIWWSQGFHSLNLLI